MLEKIPDFDSLTPRYPERREENFQVPMSECPAVYEDIFAYRCVRKIIMTFVHILCFKSTLPGNSEIYILEKHTHKKYFCCKSASLGTELQIQLEQVTFPSLDSEFTTGYQHRSV